MPRDENGVIYDPQYDGHHPLLVAHYALSRYANYFEMGDCGSLGEFWPQVRWLRDNLVTQAGFGVWQYPFDVESFAARAPWASGLMQAWGISAMLEAAALDPDHAEGYNATAHMALQAFTVPVAEGGVRSAWEDGAVWYEEYATDLNSHVLNGFMFALASLHQYWNETGDADAARMFEEGVDSLRAKLPQFDKGFTSAYDMYHFDNAAGGGGYHTVHIQQLLWLYSVTGDQYFWDTAASWVNYDGWSGPRGPFITAVEASFKPDDPAFSAERLIDNTNYYG